ncbi:MAG: hypothetical protein ACREF5_01795 [Candidatus Saccharimonadales bacterium]
MYRLGHRIKRHYRLYITLCLLVIALVVIVSIFQHVLRPNTTLKQVGSSSSYYSAGNTATQLISEPNFTIDLPVGWHSVPDPGSPYNVYSWQGTGTDADRHLDVYISDIPTNLAINHLLPVQAVDNHINVIGNASDNCTNFTPAATEDVSAGTAAAEWDGVSFICDMANYERDVVAIGSAEGVNDITLVGSSGDQRQVLLVYTDNNTNPDYSIFSSIVESFHLQ